MNAPLRPLGIPVDALDEVFVVSAFGIVGAGFGDGFVAGQDRVECVDFLQQDFAGEASVHRPDDAGRFELVQDPARPGIADAEFPLEIRAQAALGADHQPGRLLEVHIDIKDLLEPIHLLAVPFHLAEEHRCGPDPQLLFPIKSLVHHHLFQGFTVLCGADELLEPAFEMPIILFHRHKDNTFRAYPPHRLFCYLCDWNNTGTLFLLPMIYVFLGLVFVWAIVMYFFMGEKYMRWYYRQCGRNYLEYDMGRFKVAHGVCVALVGLFGMLAISVDHDALFIVLMLLALALNYILILTWCKKKDSSSK